MKRHKMKLFTEKLKGQQGTSFLEVMIALAIMGVITTAIFKLYVTSHKNYIVQDEVQFTQQNARATIDELARQIRMAGYDLPLGMSAIVSSNTDPDTIVINYRSNNCETYLSDSMSSATSDIECATDVSCFRDGQWIFIFEPDSGGGEWFEISQVQTASKQIQHSTMALSKKYNKDAILISLNQVKFFIDKTADPDYPTLMIELKGQAPQIYADNIIDLQFQYRMKNGILLDSLVLADDLREVLISVTGRSLNEDVDFDNFGVTDDSYRYRTFGTSVFLRNVGI